jgi:methionine synthase II (cobalamin-independent)
VERVKLPKDKVLIPGVITHASNIVEHPELIAERLIRYAERVGRESAPIVASPRRRRTAPKCTPR